MLSFVSSICVSTIRMLNTYCNIFKKKKKQNQQCVFEKEKVHSKINLNYEKKNSSVLSLRNVKFAKQTKPKNKNKSNIFMLTSKQKKEQANEHLHLMFMSQAHRNTHAH